MANRTANPAAVTICVEPFKLNSIDIRQEGGVAKVNQKERLTGLKVVYGNDKFQPGDVVYFEGEQCVTQWAKKIYDLDGVRFVVAPVNLIVVVEQNHPVDHLEAHIG
jgi:hypothetical protein